MSTTTVGKGLGSAFLNGLTAIGNSQTSAFALYSNVLHQFSTVASGTGAILPTVLVQPTSSPEVIILNSGANTLLVYPPVGGAINGGTTNAPASLTAGDVTTFWASTPINWFSVQSPGAGGGGGSGTVNSGASGDIAVYSSSGPAVSGQSLSSLATSLNLSGTNTGDQTITLTGPVTGTGLDLSQPRFKAASRFRAHRQRPRSLARTIRPRSRPQRLSLRPRRFRRHTSRRVHFPLLNCQPRD